LSALLLSLYGYSFPFLFTVYRFFFLPWVELDAGVVNREELVEGIGVYTWLSIKRPIGDLG
jgi:hypothetical protein